MNDGAHRYAAPLPSYHPACCFILLTGYSEFSRRAASKITFSAQPPAMTPEGDTVDVARTIDVIPRRLCSNSTKLDNVSFEDLHNAE
jgi:hypothetical protein